LIAVVFPVFPFAKRPHAGFDQSRRKQSAFDWICPLPVVNNSSAFESAPQVCDVRIRRQVKEMSKAAPSRPNPRGKVEIADEPLSKHRFRSSMCSNMYATGSFTRLQLLRG
jgi:hypothetical protein